MEMHQKGELDTVLKGEAWDLDAAHKITFCVPRKRKSHNKHMYIDIDKIPMVYAHACHETRRE